MADLTLRSTKGSALTYGEVDGNWTEINRRTGTGWNDLVQDVTVVTSGNAPVWTQFKDGIYSYAFEPSALNECFTNFHLRHDYIPGEMIYPHVHWSVKTSSTGVVRWGVEYTLAQRNEDSGLTTFGSTSTLYIEFTIGSASPYMHIVSEPTDGNGIPGTNLDVDALVLCRYFRDGAHVNDTFPDDVFLLTVDVHYPCDVANTPNRTPPFG